MPERRRCVLLVFGDAVLSPTPVRGGSSSPDGPWAYDPRVALSSGKRLLLLALVASLCATAALAILILLFGDFGETEGRILATTAAISFFSLLSLPAAILLDQQRLLPLAWATLALAATAFVVAMTLVWGELESERRAKLLLTIAAYAIAATQTSGSASRTHPDDSPSVRALFLAAAVLVLVLATMATAAAWAEIDSETYYRLLAALAVANVLLVVLQPVLRRTTAADGQPAHRLRLVLADARERELELEARDFADAAAIAIATPSGAVGASCGSSGSSLPARGSAARPA